MHKSKKTSYPAAKGHPGKKPVMPAPTGPKKKGK